MNRTPAATETSNATTPAARAAGREPAVETGIRLFWTILVCCGFGTVAGLNVAASQVGMRDNYQRQ